MRWCLWIGIFCLVPAFPVQAASRIDFNHQIRPILSENCYFCHGPDEGQRQADLRLDIPDGAAAVLSPESPEDSELIRRITSTDEYEQMPPPDSHRQLTPEQIELLKQWVEQGAQWEGHWSFQPLQRPDLPEMPSAENEISQRWSRNPIDRFVLSKLESQELSPSPRAGRVELLRRVSFDLTGLPPTIEEIDAFLADERPDAYEQVVDRLLASPAYGERMAWPWLDAARYADTNGYQGDNTRTMWPWRDWVVDAFNKNLPYDKFTVWQLAGDLLPDATHEQILATGFCRNHMINGEGGRIAEENRVEYVMDMTETMGSVWLGLTVNCCRCHDHKFDALSQANYYELFAFFNQTPVDGAGGNAQTAPIIPAPTHEQTRKKAELQSELAKLNRSIDERQIEIVGQRGEWETRQVQQLQGTSQWEIVRPTEFTAEKQDLHCLDDGSILADGVNPENDTYTLRAPVGLTSISGIRLEAIRHSSMTAGGLARSNSGNFVLTAMEIELHTPGKPPLPVHISSAAATYEQNGLKVTGVFDKDPSSGWAVHEGHFVDRDHEAVFRFDHPYEILTETTIQIVLRHDSINRFHNLGHFRLSLTAAPQIELSTQEQQLLSALQTPEATRSPAQKEAVDQAFHKSDAELADLKQQQAALQQQQSQLQDQIAQVMVMGDRDALRPTYILTKGIYDKHEATVTADVPDALPPLPDDAPHDRLGLANWLVSEANPLMARVTTNRFWQQFFGIGLVKTPDDFGVQGDVPVQKELLDWLAVEFRDSGWDVKHLVRQIVTSETYCQSSKIRPELQEADPENRLLARAPRYRLPSWMIRDNALAASGLLVEEVGGGPVNGYQPPGIWEEATFGFKSYNQDHGSALYRRSLYTFWRRIVAPTVFFDVASRQQCVVKVGRTNTPLHALLTMNDVTFVEAARVLAEHALTDTPDDAARLTFVFRRATSRFPTEEESAILLRRLDILKSQFANDAAAAEKLLATGESPRNQDLSTIDHAAWTVLCSLIFNLDEALTKQ